MIEPDYINAVFEGLGAIFCGLSVFKTYRDKMVRGVYWPSVMFFASWGWWNVYYYPAIDQFYSFLAGCVLAFVNSVWVGQLIFYTMAEKSRGG